VIGAYREKHGPVDAYTDITAMLDAHEIDILCIGTSDHTHCELVEAGCRAGLAMRARLAQPDPGNAGWQRDLSVSYAKLAIVFRNTGKKEQALDALREGRAIMARMTSLSPDNAEWKRDLAWIDIQLAELSG